MRIIVKIRYFLLVLVFLLLMQYVISCNSIDSQQAEKPPNHISTELNLYLEKEKLIRLEHNRILKKAIETIDTINQETQKPNPTDSSKTQIESIEHPKSLAPTTIQAITVDSIKQAFSATRNIEPNIPTELKRDLISGVTVLCSTKNQLSELFNDHNGLHPPSEALTYHSLFIGLLYNEQALFNYFLLNYQSLLENGYSNIEALDNVNLLLETNKQLDSVCGHEWSQLFVLD